MDFFLENVRGQVRRELQENLFSTPLVERSGDEFDKAKVDFG
jgi:hypothetical protein